MKKRKKILESFLNETYFIFQNLFFLQVYLLLTYSFQSLSFATDISFGYFIQILLLVYIKLRPLFKGRSEL